jgi:predicted transglutaminase-like cysteine proteinase
VRLAPISLSMPVRAHASILGAVALLASAFGCVIGQPPRGAFHFFEKPAPDDPWSRKIARWQVRERAQGVGDAFLSATGTVASGPEPAARSADEDLRAQYASFRAEQKRATARAIARWVQDNAKLHYVADGPYDHWATLEETLARNGDDCDGLELLTYHFLRDAGFRDDEVYRAIVLRPSDGQHHMVTLWFEEAGDPWVIDPTGAMVAGMPRMSEVPDWVPIKLFSETAEFTVRGPGLARVSVATAHGLTPAR